MDGENHGKAYFFMDDLGGENPLFLGSHPYDPNLSKHLQYHENQLVMDQ